MIFRGVELQVLKPLKKPQQPGSTVSRVHYSIGEHGKHDLRFWRSPSQGPSCAVRHRFSFFFSLGRVAKGICFIATKIVTEWTTNVIHSSNIPLFLDVMYLNPHQIRVIRGDDQ